MEEKVLSRVRKMLALAHNEAASDGERDNALRMAYATLAKHNLTMTEVNASPVGEEQRGDTKITIRNRMWMVTIHHAVAKLFFCHLFITKRPNYIDMTFVGKEGNITTAKEMAAYLCASILRENEAQVPDQAWRASFNKGAAHRVWERCQALRKEAEAAPVEKSAGTSMVLASLYKREEDANADYIKNQMGITLHSAKERKQARVHSSAYEAGREYGGKLNLHRQVGGDTSNQKFLAS